MKQAGLYSQNTKINFVVLSFIILNTVMILSRKKLVLENIIDKNIEVGRQTQPPPSLQIYMLKGEFQQTFTIQIL